jgi:hypothetical protein
MVGNKDGGAEMTFVPRCKIASPVGVVGFKLGAAFDPLDRSRSWLSVVLLFNVDKKTVGPARG